MEEASQQPPVYRPDIAHKLDQRVRIDLVDLQCGLVVRDGVAPIYV
jgi:hypothetical protein